MKEIELAWAAGLFDGEGCVCISKTKPKKLTWSYKYGLNVSIGMTHKETVKNLHRLFGGTYREVPPPSADKNWALQYRWRINEKQAKSFILAILPYSFTKKEQLMLALEYLDLPLGKSGTRPSGELIMKREHCHVQMQCLNKRGK